MPPLKDLPLTGEALIKKFAETLVEETGIVYRVKDNREALEKLAQIAGEEGLKCVMASTDDVLTPLDLPAWGKKNGVQVMTPKDFADRDSFRDAVFDRAQAGITGADFAVAESGSIGLIHDKDQARLVSLAPILHIAIVPVERIYPVYEPVIEKVFGKQWRGARRCARGEITLSQPIRLHHGPEHDRRHPGRSFQRHARPEKSDRDPGWVKTA